MSAQDNLSPQQFYHGTRRGPFKVGDVLTGGHPRSSNSNPGEPLGHVYFHSDPMYASNYATTDEESEIMQGHPAVYSVQPLDNPEIDWDLRNGSLKSRAVRITGVIPWGDKRVGRNPHDWEKGWK